MLKKERQERILELVNESEYLTNSEIASILDVSEMTIRRDISELDKEGKVNRLYGGVEKINFLAKELSTKEKIDVNVSQKKYIGSIINSIITENSTVYLGAGTTIFHSLPYIKKRELFIITNSLIAFLYLKEKTNYRLMLTGGEFSPITEEFVGSTAEKSLENININYSFASTNGVFENNVTTAQYLEGGIQLAALRQSQKKYIVADASILGRSDVYTFENLSNFDGLITDNTIDITKFNTYSKFTQIIKEPIR